MYAFTFHRPQTVRQAASLLGKNEDAKLLAGGQTLLPTMKLRLAGPPQHHRHVADRGPVRHRAERPLAHDRRDDAPRRRRTPRRWCSRRSRRSPSSPA